jgi:uncharacterized protein YqeY
MKNLKEIISKDFITAFKAKDMNKKNFLGVVKGEIQLQEGRGVESTDENVLKVLKKIEKSLKQTNTEESNVELSYIKKYLPEQMEENTIRKIIIEYTNSGMSNVGQIMGNFNKEHKGKADNKMVSEIVKSILN